MNRARRSLRPGVVAGTLSAALLFGVAASADEPRDQPELGSGYATAPELRAERWMIVTAHPLATDAGQAILSAGGSAVDAAIAAQMVLNLVEPQSSGIGGGAFGLHFDAASGDIDAFDGRETAPAAVDETLFLNAEGEPLGFWDAVIGGRSVGVPGLLRMLELAHSRHGRLPWAGLFQPAIELAETGFEVSPRMATSIAEARELDRYPAARAYFFDDAGEPLAAGTHLRNPALAETLRAIAAGGADAFHHGPIAEAIVDTVRSADPPGRLDARDLADYQAQVRVPVCVPYRAREVCGMGPPSSGGVAVAQILGLLEHFDPTALPALIDRVHLFAEAARLAFADRDLYLADSDFVAVPVRGLLEPAYLTHRAQRIQRHRASPDPGPGNPRWREAELRAPDRARTESGTTHLSVVDADGNALSMTSSIEMGFGSRLFVGGFLLNNQLTDFSFRPERDGRPVANRVEAGKRPRSSMAPTLVLDANGRPELVIGSPGGSRIIPYVARVLVSVLDHGLAVNEAIGSAHYGNRDGPTELEAGHTEPGLRMGLEERGHEVVEVEMVSGVHAIHRVDGGLHAGVDPRREGAAAGE